jgi:hypothetical protein
MSRYTTHPALKAQDRYARACANFDRRLDGYLRVREHATRDSAPAQAALAALQSAKALRLATWNAWQGWCHA